MSSDQKFYNSLGSFFCGTNSSESIDTINEQIYDDINLVIKLVAINSIDTPFCYKILRIECDKNGTELGKFVEELNERLKKSGNNAAYFSKDEKGNNWSIFYLLKELISKFKESGYNYYRGQRESWPTVPALFRNKVDKEENYYYESFEQLYRNVSQEYPDKVQYIPIDDNIESRSDQLAKLQHYELPTSLLDITDNPFVALLFLSDAGSGIIKKPKFEAFKMEVDEHSNHSLLTLVRKGQDNQRIRAQHGAFINYDKLSQYTHFVRNEVKISDDFKKIPRISVIIDFSKEETDANLKLEEEAIESNTRDDNGIFVTKEKLQELKSGKLSVEELLSSAELNDVTKRYSTANIEAVRSSIKSDKFEEDYYKIIQEELIRKLGEYGYFSYNLFPDFGDYLGHLSKTFEFKNTKTNSKIDRSKVEE